MWHEKREMQAENSGFYGETMLTLARNIHALLDKSAEEELRTLLAGAEHSFPFDPVSVHKLGRSAVLIAGSPGDRRLLVVADCGKRLPDGFEGERFALDDGGVLLCCGFSAANAAALRRHFPWCTPKVVPKTGRTAGFAFGAGARGRLEAVREAGCFPVISGWPDEVVFFLFASDFRDGYAVNGGCASTPAEAERLFRSGATLALLRPCGGGGMEADYAGKRFVIGSGVEVFDGDTVARCCASCGGLADFAAKLGGGERRCSLGIALDGEEKPTRPEEHLFVVREMRKRNVDFAILFPRWPEESAAFGELLRRHAAIARTFGGYRISIPLDRIADGMHGALRQLEDGIVHLELGEASGTDFTNHFHGSGLKET